MFNVCKVMFVGLAVLLNAFGGGLQGQNDPN
jgi:hypothetical protein